MAGPIDALLSEWSDAFDEQVADNTTNRIDASGTYDFNIGRHIFLENGTFIRNIDNTTALVDLPSKFQVTATAGDEHVFGARELIRYVPVYELLTGAAAWADTALTDGQHFAIEFSGDTFENGYRYHFRNTTGTPELLLEQASGGSVVKRNDAELDELEAREKLGFSHTQPFIARKKLNWYGAGECRFEPSFPLVGDDDEIIDQTNPIIGRTGNRDDVATQEANQRIQVRVWCDEGAADLTVNICSLGAIVRGNATEVDREKPALFWGVGGSISQYPTDNVADAMAARIDPERNNVVSKVEPPIFQPNGSGIVMELGVYAVHKDHPDLTVNFDDPDDDGTNEGPSPAAQSRAQTDVMQYTRDVTSIPTATDIRADGTTGLVPDMRQLTLSRAESGGQTSPGAVTGGEVSDLKRVIFKDDVVIFLPRTSPLSNTTSATIEFLKPVFLQDW